MKGFAIRLLVLTTLTIWGAIFSFPDNKLHVIFCNVGQGDATLITYNTQQILVDSGPDNRVMECLSRHMPFYDRTIEAVVVTHAQQDHRGGSRYLGDRYSVVQFEPVLVKGDKVVVGKLNLETIWPKKRVLGLSTLGKENDEGIVSELSWRNFKLLLTADVSDKYYDNENRITVLKVPHHGSKYALNREWLEKARPAIAVISVGKNSYGHPAPEVLQMLEELGIKTLRTDLEGELEIITDGETYTTKSTLR